MKRKAIDSLAFLFLLLAGLLAACNQQAEGPNPNAPGFTLSLQPGELSLLQWSTTRATLTITPKKGFHGTVRLELENGPSGVSLAPNEVEVTGSDPVVVPLVFTATEDAEAGSFAARLKGTSGEATARASLDLTVRPLAKTWVLRSVPLHAVASDGSGKLVAVGLGGKVLVSTDGGTTWATHSVGMAVPLTAVAYGNGKFVAAGFGSQAFVSEDGEHWEHYPLDSQNQSRVFRVLAMAYGNGEFQAVGYGVRATSSDGIHWSTIADNSYDYYDIAFGGGYFAYVGYDHLNDMGFLEICDSSECYEQGTGSTDTVLAVTYNLDGHTFLATDREKVYTTDVNDTGHVWTSSTIQSGAVPSHTRLAYGAGRYLAVGASGRVSLAEAQDPTRWTVTWVYTRQNPPVHASGFNGVLFTGGRFVAVGSGNMVATSDNGSTWTLSISGTGSYVGGLAYDGRRFLAVDGDNGQVYASPDGASWEPVSEAATYLEDLAYDGQVYAAVGHGSIFTSEDATTWSRHTLNGYPAAITSGSGKIVAVGDSGYVAYSGNHGASWDETDAGTTENLLGVAYGNGTFVAVGEGGTIVYSNDGATWHAASSGTTEDLNGVAFGDGRFVAVGTGGTLLVSSDGNSWSAPITAPSLGGNTEFDAVAYDATTGFVAVGIEYRFPENNRALIVYSPDGLSWDKVAEPPTAFGLSSVACGNGACVTGGDEGLILQTAR